MLCGSWRWETTLSFAFFSSLRLLDITYFYPVPLLLDLIRDGRHTISYASKLSRCGEERWESQREDRNSSWKFVLRSVHNICGQGKMPRERVQDLAGRQEWANKLTTFVCEQLLVAVCVCKQIHRLGSLLPAQLTKLIIRLELQPRRDLIIKIKDFSVNHTDGVAPTLEVTGFFSVIILLVPLLDVKHYDVPPKSRGNRGISTAVSFDMCSDRSVHTQPSFDGSFEGGLDRIRTGISWMLRVLVETVTYRLWTTGIDVLGNVLNALICLVHLRSATSLKQLPSLWVDLRGVWWYWTLFYNTCPDINGLVGFTTRRNTLLFDY